MLALLISVPALAEGVQPTPYRPGRRENGTPPSVPPDPSTASTKHQERASTKPPTASSLSASSNKGRGDRETLGGNAAAVDRAAVISYLGQLISWYRHLAVEERLATDPAEILYVADDRQNAGQVLDLGFTYAQAAAKLLNAPAPPAGQLSNLLAHRAEAQAAAAAAQSRVRQLGQALRRARRKERDLVAHQLATADAELTLAQSQADSLAGLISFQQQNGGGSDFEMQIGQLKAAVGPLLEQKAPPPSMIEAAAPPSGALHRPETASGIVGGAEALLVLTRKSQSLDDTIELTKNLLAAAEQLQKPLRGELRQLDQAVVGLAAGGASNNLALVKDTQARVEELGRRHKRVLAALLPLSEQTVVLNQYLANLGQWDSALRQRFSTDLRNLLLRLGGLLMVLLAVLLAGALWRRVTFRYVHDMQRRHQLLLLSRIIVIAIMALVLLFDFANELGALATVMGFAAAGIALTLQNVILSMAGYFYVSGRYGIRVGDRVQISGISGDVLEIGLFKITMMELGGDESGRQPTGRVVVFPNSVVFQPNSNFSRQLPGSSFAWNELRLTLAPDCDYRLAERRVLEVVSEVFARFREAIQRECRGLERELNQPIETPRPQSRLRLSEAGIEIVLRYPVPFRNSSQTADEIARRLVDAIKREPALRLVTPGTPMIQPAESAEAQPHQGLLNGEPLSPGQSAESAEVDNHAAAIATAAAAGATIADAFVETSAAAQAREGVAQPLPPAKS